MGDLPTVIRLIDPPLHEFLPSYEELLVKATELRVKIEYMRKDNVDTSSEQAQLKETEEMLKAVAGMKEANPMLGLRGCRLGITMPQITVMQTRAILEAACTLKKRGVNVASRNHDPARRSRERAEEPARDPGSGSEEGDRGAGRRARIQVRHDDRNAARRADRGARSPSTRSSSRSARTT